MEHWQKYLSEGTMVASRVASEPKFLQERPDATVEILAAVSRCGGIGGRSSRRILEEDRYTEGKTGKG